MRVIALVAAGVAGLLAAVAVASSQPDAHPHAAVSPTSTTTSTSAGTSVQSLFSAPLLADAKVTKSIKSMLRNGTGFIDPSPVIADLNDDGKADAVVSVTTGGAGGTFAVYVLSTIGTKSGTLRVVFRSQSLYAATTSVDGDSLTIANPHWGKGDDVCCPVKVVEKTYEWRASAKTFIRTETKSVPGPTQSGPASTTTTTTPTTTTG